MSAGPDLVRVFEAQLKDMGGFLDHQAETVWHEAMQGAAEAVVLGNKYGPGVPVDTGFLRASFRLGRNAPDDGPTTRPKGLPSGGMLPPQLDMGQIARSVLGETVYLTTVAEYAVYLEEGTTTRGTLERRSAEQQLKDQKGTRGPTPFIAPVEARWQQIVDDAARRVSGDT